MNQPGTSSGAIAATSGAQQITGPGVLLWAQLQGASGTDVFTIYDGTSTGGLMLCSLEAKVAATNVTANISQGVCFNTGLYVVVTGTSSTGILHYRRN